MQQIIKFIEKNRYFLLFLLLEFVALFFTIQSHSYHKSKFVNSANAVTGGIYKKANSIGEFFNLKKENLRLSEENALLKNQLAGIDGSINTYQKENLSYHYIPAKIYNNSYKKRNNYLTINKGRNDSIKPEMGVVNSRGIIGITKNVSKNYATVLSILNEHFKINAKLKNNNHYGTLSWDGKNYRTVQLNDLPREAEIRIGDTIITGGRSTIFPEGILVGTVAEFEEHRNTSKKVTVTLFNDMSALGYIEIISNLHKEEILELEAQNNE